MSMTFDQTMYQHASCPRTNIFYYTYRICLTRTIQTYVSMKIKSRRIKIIQKLQHSEGIITVIINSIKRYVMETDTLN